MPDPDRGRIGPRLRQLRIDAGLTQAELAERAGVADGTISRLERGRLRDPSAQLVGKLADGLGVGVEQLLRSTAKPAKGLRGAEARLLAQVRDLDDAAVDDVTKAVKLLVAVGRRTAGLRRKPTARLR
jgi:putative transcriptional regulator